MTVTKKTISQSRSALIDRMLIEQCKETLHSLGSLSRKNQQIISASAKQASASSLNDYKKIAKTLLSSQISGNTFKSSKLGFSQLLTQVETLQKDKKIEQSLRIYQAIIETINSKYPEIDDYYNGLYDALFPICMRFKDDINTYITDNEKKTYIGLFFQYAIQDHDLQELYFNMIEMICKKDEKLIAIFLSYLHNYIESIPNNGSLSSCDFIVISCYHHILEDLEEYKLLLQSYQRRHESKYHFANEYIDMLIKNNDYQTAIAVLEKMINDSRNFYKAHLIDKIILCYIELKLYDKAYKLCYDLLQDNLDIKIARYIKTILSLRDKAPKSRSVLKEELVTKYSKYDKKFYGPDERLVQFMCEEKDYNQARNYITTRPYKFGGPTKLLLQNEQYFLNDHKEEYYKYVSEYIKKELSGSADVSIYRECAKLCEKLSQRGYKDQAIEIIQTYITTMRNRKRMVEIFQETLKKL